MKRRKLKSMMWSRVALLVVALLLGAFTTVDAQDTWTSGECTVTLTSSGTLKVSKASGKGRMADYNAANDLGDPAPWYDWPNRRIKAIIIDDGVSYIGAYAFADCEGVESVTLPESLTEIARGAFSGCFMSQITIPANVTKIGEDAFYGCNFLHNIYMYADVASLTWTDNENPDFSYYGTACHVNKADREAFANKFNFKHLTFWGDLDQIDGPWISGDCEVELNKNGTLTVSKNGSDSEGRMGDFYGNTPWLAYAADIKKIVIAEGVTYIGKNAFRECNYATTVSLPSTLTTIGGAAFELCSGLQSITLPEGLTTINYYAFRNCTGLTTITFPASVTYIDAFSFLDCTSITDVYCYPDPTKLTWWAGSNADDFKPKKATKCHVWTGYQTYYQQNFDLLNVTWVGDLELPGQDMGIAIDASNFPDVNFRQFVHDLDANNGDDYLSDAELSLVTWMNIAFKEITDLTGIGYFTELTQLDCSGNQLNTLNLSQNTNLTSLNCWGAHLTSLDVSGNTNLSILTCYDNQLTSLDLSQNAKLYALDCSHNQLTTLDLSHNTGLRSLRCYYNQITGSGLSDLLASLPDGGGSLYEYAGSNDGNSETTLTERNTLRDKGWSVFYLKNNDWNCYDNKAYNVWVGATQVTELNLNNVLGDGTVKYNPETCTLTFESGKTVIEGVYDVHKIFSRGIDLTINAPEGLLIENPTGFGICLDYSYSQDNYKKLTVNGDITFNTLYNPVVGCSDFTVNGNLTIHSQELTLNADNVTVNGNAKGSGTGFIITAGKSLVLNGTSHVFTATKNYPCIKSNGTLTIAGDLTATSKGYYAVQAKNDITMVSGTWTLDGGVNEAGYSSAAIRSDNGPINIPSTHQIMLPTQGHVDALSNFTTIVDKSGYSAAQRVIIVDNRDVVCLYENADNSQKLEEHHGETFDVSLSRTLKKAQAGVDSWNTFAAPFDITDLNGVFGRGVKVKKLTGSTVTNGTLTLTFADASKIEAGKPYLVKVPADLNFVDHVIEDVTISKNIVPTVTDAVEFVPTLSETVVEGDPKSWFFLVSRNRFSYVDERLTNYPIKGFRAYFRLKDPAAVRSIQSNLDEEVATSLREIRNEELEMRNADWYTVDGRKLSGQPTAKGVYINNGKKIIVK